MKVLHNQQEVSTKPYSNYTTTLPEALKRAGRKQVDMESFIAGVEMYRLSKDYDVVVTVGHRPAFTFNLLNMILGKKCQRSVAKEFYLESAQPPQSIKAHLWLFVKKIYRQIALFAYNALDLLIVNSKAEIQLYSAGLDIPQKSIVFVPWPSNIDPAEAPIPGKGYVFSAGRSHRDWKTFLEAVEGLDIPVVIVATRQDTQYLSIPANVTLHTDISHASYKELLRKAELVVLPLVSMERSTGQASFLEAMSYGKPLIVSDVIGSRDYIEHNRNGMTVEPENPAQLRAAIIELMENKEQRLALGQEALNDIQHKFNKYHYSEMFLSAIQKTLS